MDETNTSCPICKSDRYLNPTLALLVSPCFHKMCDSCVNRIFLAGPSPCPVCKTILKKSNFVSQTFEDLLVEREVQIRKRYGKYYNKRLEDYRGDLKAFNDYLEEAETIIFDLIHENNVDATKAKIEQYRIDNKDLIAANSARQVAEDKNQMFMLDREKIERGLRKQAYETHALEQTLAKETEQQDLINKLASTKSKTVIKTIIDQQTSKIIVNDVYKPIIKIGVDLGDVHQAEMEMHQAYLQNESEMQVFDHIYPEFRPFDLHETYADPWTQDYRGEPLKFQAGGFEPSFIYDRAISSAFAGLFETP